MSPKHTRKKQHRHVLNPNLGEQPMSMESLRHFLEISPFFLCVNEFLDRCLDLTIDELDDTSDSDLEKYVAWLTTLGIANTHQLAIQLDDRQGLILELLCSNFKSIDNADAIQQSYTVSLYYFILAKLAAGKDVSTFISDYTDLFGHSCNHGLADKMVALTNIY